MLSQSKWVRYWVWPFGLSVLLVGSESVHICLFDCYFMSRGRKF